MTDDAALDKRLRFLREVVEREARYLGETDGRLFAGGLTRQAVERLPHEPDLSERVDAFVARFGRLQDTLGDKLLPALLTRLAEPIGPVIDNLARAERWLWIDSSEDWLRLRQLRNRMIHEYVKDPAVLLDALQSAHDGVPTLLAACRRMTAEVARRLPG